MTTVQAKIKNLKIAPRKVRLAAGLLKGISVNEALAQLELSNSRSRGALIKLIKSALANAKNKNLDTSRLMVQSIIVDEGQRFKRQLPRARGRATLLLKRLSHVTLTLGESEKVAPPKFTIYEIKKEKAEKIQKAETAKPKFKSEEQAKSKPRSGILQKIFRRKAV